MITLDVEARLGYARAAVAVLRALKVMDAKMTYRNFAIAVGITSEDEKWKPWHKNQVAVILRLTAATERLGRAANFKPLEFERLVSAATKQPGAGYYKKPKIVTKK